MMKNPPLNYLICNELTIAKKDICVSAISTFVVLICAARNNIRKSRQI